MAGTLAPFLAPATALALPQGGTVAAGSATVSTPTATSLRVDQFSDRAVLDWQSFNIAVNEAVRFQQPSAASIALNRVAGQEPSGIYGSLSANGQIFLINPSGILFSSSSRVDVGALTASTMNITNQDFMAGNYRFTQDPNYANAAVVNQGVITAGPGGYVALLGAAVRNEGVIVANLGSIALAAGKAATLDMRGDGLIEFVVTDAVSGSVTGPSGESLTSYVSNTGTLQADGGMVTMTGRAVTDVIKSVVNQEGVIRATSLVDHGGVVKLVASDPVENTGAIGWENNLGRVQNAAGEVTNYGTIDVSAGEAGAAQGQVTLAGQYVGHAGTILARGADNAQGGRVLLTSSDMTIVTSTGAIDTSGVGNSSAGNVVVWSDNDTIFSGSIIARGGAAGGDGGNVEVSGYLRLGYRGLVDLSAPLGLTGTLLLDPDVIELRAGTASDGSDTTDASASNLNDSDSVQGKVAFADNTDADPYLVFEGELEGTDANIVLEARSKISVQTTSDFADNQILIKAGRNLTLRTRNDVGDGADGIDLTTSVDGANLEFKTQGSGSITIETGVLGAVTPQAAPITVGKLTTGAPSAGTNSGSITINGTGTVTVSGALTTGDASATANNSNIASGSITLTSSQSNVVINVAVTTGKADNTGNTSTAASGTIAVSGKTGVTIGAAVTTGAVTEDDNDSIIGSGGITLTSSQAGVTINAAVTTGNASLADFTGGNEQATTGSITVSAATSVSGNAGGVLTTGNAALAGSNTGTDVASSGKVMVTAGTGVVSGGIGLSAANALVTGTATDDNGSVSTGKIILSSIDEINNGTSSTPLSVSIGAPSATTGTQTTGRLEASTTGASGNIFVTSASDLSVGPVTTTNRPVSISVSAGKTYTQTDADISTGSGAITITTDKIAIAANTGNNAFQTTGTLTLKPASAATTMSLAGASTFDLSAAEVTDLAGGVTGAGTIVIGENPTSTGVLTVGGAVDFGAKTVTLNAGSFTDGDTTTKVIKASTLNLNASTAAIGSATADNAIDTTVTTVTASAATGGVFIKESDGADFTATVAGGAGDISLTSTSGTLNIAGATNTGGGKITLSSGGAVTLGAPLGSGTTGVIAINANNDGAGAEGFTQNVGGTITTGDAGAAAVAIRVNTASGTGSAALRDITTGSGGTITVDTSNGANICICDITQTAGTVLNVGSGTVSLKTGGGAGGSSTIGTVGANVLTKAGTITATNDSTGGIFITESDGVTLSSVTSAGPVTITTTTGDLTVNTIAAGAQAVTLKATAGSILDDGNDATKITGGTVTLSAVAGNVGAPGSGNIDVAASVALSATSGLSAAATDGIFVNVTGAFDIAGLNSARTIDVTASGDITNGFGAVSSQNNGNIQMVSTGGLMNLSNPVTADGSGNVTLKATGSVSVGNVSSTTGTVTINANTAGADADGFIQGGGVISTGNTTANAVVITVNDAAGATGTASIGEIAVGVGGGITVQTTGQAGTTTTGGSIVHDFGTFLTASSGSVTLRTGTTGSIFGSFGDDVDAVTAKLIIEARDFFVSNNFNNLTDLTITTYLGGFTRAVADVPNISSLTISDDLTNVLVGPVSNSGSPFNFSLTAGTGGLSVAGAITIPGATVTLSSPNGAILDGNLFGTDITATSLALSAKAGIGSADPIETAVTNLAFSNTTSGNVQITNSGALTIAAVGALPTSSNIGGTTTITTTSPLTFSVDTTSAGTLTATAGEINDPGVFADDLTVNDNVIVRSTGGDVILRAGDDINLMALSTVKSDAGAVTLQAGFGDLDGSGVLNLLGAIIRTTLNLSAVGDITLVEAGDIDLGSLDAGSGTVTLTSTNGAIKDDNGAATNITAKNAVLSAKTGIGDGDALETVVTNLAFSNTTSGNVQIDNTGPLTIASLGALATSSNLGGATTITASSPLTFSVDTTSKDTLTATAVENPAMIAGDDLTVFGGVTVESTGGDVILRAGDSIVLQPGSTVQSGTGNVSLLAGFGDNDGFGSLILNGDIFPATVLNLSAKEDITLTQAGDINLGSLDAGALNTVTVTSTTGAIIDGNAGADNITAANAVLSAKTGIGTVADPIELAVTNVSATNTKSGDLALTQSTGDLNVGVFGTGVSNTGGGSIVLEATAGSINVVNNIDSGAGATTLTAGDRIIAGGGTVLAGDLILTAVNGIGPACQFCGPNPLPTQVSNLQATNTNNGIEINNTGDLTLKDLGAGFAVSNTNGGVVISATGDLTVSDAVSSGRRLSLRANGDLLINADLTADTTGAGFTIELISDNDGNGTGGIIQDATSLITSNDNSVFFGVECAPAGGCGSGGGGATQNITVGSVDAGTGGVFIRTEDGGVLDANGAGTNNITAADLVIRSEQGVDLDTTVSRLSVRNGFFSGAGDVTIRNTAATLTLENFFFCCGGFGGVFNAGGTTTITNAGNIVSGLVDGAADVISGTLTLETTGGGTIGAAGAGNELEINAKTLNATTAGGLINVSDPNALTVMSASSSGGDITFITGSTLTLAGDIMAGGGTVTLHPLFGGVNQMSGSITASDLLLTSNDGFGSFGFGAFSLTSATNDVGTLAASVNGNIAYTDMNALTVGTVTGVAGITAADPTDAFGNNVTLNVSTLTLAQAINTGGDLIGGVVTLNLTAALADLGAFDGKIVAFNPFGVASFFGPDLEVTAPSITADTPFNFGTSPLYPPGVSTPDNFLTLISDGAITVNAPITTTSALFATAKGAITGSGGIGAPFTSLKGSSLGEIATIGGVTQDPFALGSPLKVMTSVPGQVINLRAFSNGTLITDGINIFSPHPLVLGQVSSLAANGAHAIRIDSARQIDGSAFDFFFEPPNDPNVKGSTIVFLSSNPDRIGHGDVDGIGVGVFVASSEGAAGVFCGTTGATSAPLCSTTGARVFSERGAFESFNAKVAELVSSIISAVISGIIHGPPELLTSGRLPENVFKSLGSETIEVVGGVSGGEEVGGEPVGVKIIDPIIETPSGEEGEDEDKKKKRRGLR